MDAYFSKNLEYNLTTQALEHLTPSQHAIELCEKVFNQEMTTEAAIDAILKAHGLTREQRHV